MRYRIVRPGDEGWPAPVPRKKHLLIELTEAQRTFLITASIRGVRPPEIKRGDFHPATLRTLEAQGLVHLTVNRKKRDIWRPTDTGRALVASHQPRFLHRHSEKGYTHIGAHAMRSEPEAV